VLASRGPGVRVNALGVLPIAPALEKRIREALATPGRPGVRVIAKQVGVNPGTVGGSIQNVSGQSNEINGS
jgi:hypothetical protein